LKIWLLFDVGYFHTLNEKGMTRARDCLKNGCEGWSWTGMALMRSWCGLVCIDASSLALIAFKERTMLEIGKQKLQSIFDDFANLNTHRTSIHSIFSSFHRFIHQTETLLTPFTTVHKEQKHFWTSNKKNWHIHFISHFVSRASHYRSHRFSFHLELRSLLISSSLSTYSHSNLFSGFYCDRVVTL
jgi:hypothetical protein